jgi:hypothetical protein
MSKDSPLTNGALIALRSDLQLHKCSNGYNLLRSWYHQLNMGFFDGSRVRVWFRVMSSCEVLKPVCFLDIASVGLLFLNVGQSNDL